MIKSIQHNHAFPSPDSHPSVHQFGNTWDGAVIRRLILKNSFLNKRPAFLYLGRVETELLRKHLAQAFGEDAVTTLHDTYYLDLRVITVDEETYVALGGCKAIHQYSDPKPLSIAS